MLPEKKDEPLDIPFENNDSENCTEDFADFKKYSRYHPFTNSNRVEYNLMKLIFDIGANKYAFCEIMKRAKDPFNLGYKFDAKATTYKSQITQMQ